jgi:hypothetical protein
LPDPNSEAEKKEGWKRKAKPPLVTDRYHFMQDREGYLGRLRAHLSLFDVESRKGEVLPSGRYGETNPSWSPGGKSSAFVSSRTPDPDRNVDTNISMIDAKAGSEPRQQRPANQLMYQPPFTLMV